MRKLFIVLCLCFINTLGVSLHSQNVSQSIDRYKGFMLYEDGLYSYYTLNGYNTINGLKYIKEDGNRYCYRQEGNKVYCYDVEKCEESLVLDFGLKVGDVFTLNEELNIIVEYKSDTTLMCHNSSVECKALYLRGIEQPDFTDVWIEGIGSLKYGINPYNLKQSYMLHLSLFVDECDEHSDFCTFTFDLHESEIKGMTILLGDEIYDNAFSDYNEYKNAFENEFLEFDLIDDTLCIGGYIGSYCEKSLYFLLSENAGNINITSVIFPLEPEADCISVNSISAKIPGFYNDEYDIYFKNKVYKVSKNKTSLSYIEKNSYITEYYDLFGRRVENPQSGLYIKDGKKVFIK